LILMDIKMPDMDGIELCRLVHTHTACPAPFVIILSGYIDDANRAAAKKAGAKAVLEKPIGREELIDLFRSHDLPCNP